jgi:hypothetical protein
MEAVVAPATVDDTTETWCPSEPRCIETSITITSLGPIDNLFETADASMLIDVYWLPSKEELADNGASGSSWDPKPNFQPMNAKDTKAHNLIKPPAFKHTGGCLKWHAQIWIEATFKQSFDLRSFPLDCQSIVFRLEMGNVKQMVYTAPTAQDTILSVEKELSSLLGWDWVSACLNFSRTDPSLSKQGKSYAQLVIEVKLARQWAPYIWRVQIFTMLMMASTLIAYSLDPIEELADRLSFCFTMLLTSVAFQFTLHSMLPPVPYITLLVLVSVVFTFLVAIWSATLKAAHDSRLRRLGFDPRWNALKHAAAGGGGDSIVSDDTSSYLRLDHAVLLIHSSILLAAHCGGVIYCIRERTRQLKRLLDRRVSAPKTNLKVYRTAPRVTADGVEYSSVDPSQPHHAVGPAPGTGMAPAALPTRGASEDWSKEEEQAMRVARMSRLSGTTMM